MAKFIVNGKVKYQGKYYNSGQVIEVDAKHVEEFKKHGWQVVDGKKQEPKTPDYSKLTVNKLKALLTEKGIEFKPDAKKDELIALLA